MKNDAPFDPSVKSGSLPKGITFRLANRQDCHSINNLTAQRNPSQNFADIEANTNKEMDRLESNNNYKLYIAELNSEVIGFCRFAHSDGLSANKKIYPSPNGWYGLGILVSPKYRRLNIAKFLTSKRIEILKELGAEVY